MASKNQTSRKLAAILFADIVGYTRLMQEGESRAMAILNRFVTITRQLVDEYDGEIIKNYGDGSLIIFYQSTYFSPTHWFGHKA